jgi:GntR family transcriptional regulator
MGGQAHRAVDLEGMGISVIYSEGQPGSVQMPRRQRYEEVTEDLTSKIRSGEYPPGAKLPSRAELCEIYQVSESVIEKSMWILRREGLTETLPGVGVFVAENSM